LTIAVTIVHARDARAFERRALTTEGHIAAVPKDQQGWVQHVVVEYTTGGTSIEGQVPVVDASVYRVGQSVAVLYDHRGRLLLDAERYDAASPAFYSSALFVGGALPILFGWWWVRQVRGIAASAGPTFAMHVRVADDRPRWWNLRRPWVTILPLDAPDRPVGAYPLMAGVPKRSRAGATGEVKGQVRDGGLVVAHDGSVLWPRGRLRG